MAVVEAPVPNQSEFKIEALARSFGKVGFTAAHVS
jgi:hypothetical protein